VTVGTSGALNDTVHAAGENGVCPETGHEFSTTSLPAGSDAHRRQPCPMAGDQGGRRVRRRGPRPRALGRLLRDTAPHASYLGQRRFASLNGLRCLAISEVIWHHASGRRSGVMARGLGVDLSFVISGFLITTLLIREFSKTGGVGGRRFYMRRTLRLFPLYFAVLGM